MAFEIFLQTTIDSLSPGHPTLSFSALGHKNPKAPGSETRGRRGLGQETTRERMDKDEAYL
jgi:hypothetical protein